MTIKAIPTMYKGYKFRSRLEAKWAAFFELYTNRGLQWEYEPEGFDLDGLWYLPDFRVTSPQGYVQWYEIKPPNVPLSFTDQRKISEFDKAICAANTAIVDAKYRADFEVLQGSPRQILARGVGGICPRCGLIDASQPIPQNHDDYFQCLTCDNNQPDDSESGLFGTVHFHKGLIFIPDKLDYLNYLFVIRNTTDIAETMQFDRA